MSKWLVFLRVFFTGLCMGAADLVPGISGGTIAFIMGIYRPLIEAIRSINVKAFRQKKIPFLFLTALFLGIGCSLLGFSHAVSAMLKNPTIRPLLYSFFIGLILASLLFLFQKVKQWDRGGVLALVGGALFAYFFSGHPYTQTFESSFSQALIQPWFIFSGAVAISAMLLPGISGSYLLMVLGVYPIALEALADFSTSLKTGHFDLIAFSILANLMTGIILGGLLFSHVINWLLEKHHNLTLALLIGFMIGAMRTAWPFWEWSLIQHPYRPEKGLIPLLTKPIWPDLSSSLFWKALIIALFGFILVLFIDYLAKKVSIMHRNPSLEEGGYSKG